jgi:hypothetical protein
VNRKGSCDERNLICRIGLGLKQGLRANIVIKLIFFLGNASSYQIVIHLIYELEPLYTGEMATALLLIVQRFQIGWCMTPVTWPFRNLISTGLAQKFRTTDSVTSEYGHCSPSHNFGVSPEKM